MPPLSDDYQAVEKNAPLSKWDTIGSYDSAAACRSELAKLTAVIAGNISYSVIQKRVLAGSASPLTIRACTRTISKYIGRRRITDGLTTAGCDLGLCRAAGAVLK